MQLIFNGIQVGLALAILLGPIFFALIQTGVERGFRAGTMVGLGIWVSDLIFIASAYAGLNFITSWTKDDNFMLYLGIAGGIILVAVGIGTLLSKPPDWDSGSIIPSKASYFSLWLKGFLVNTVNPFTFFFWISMMGATVGDREYSRKEALVFFTAIITTIVITDLAKVLLAKYIRQWMTFKHIVWLRRISGSALIIFGIVLMIRSLSI